MVVVLLVVVDVVVAGTTSWHFQFTLDVHSDLQSDVVPASQVVPQLVGLQCSVHLVWPLGATRSAASATKRTLLLPDPAAVDGTWLLHVVVQLGLPVHP